MVGEQDQDRMPRPSLRQVVQQFGLEVPYCSQEPRPEPAPDTGDERVAEARRGFHSSKLFRERVEEEEEVGRRVAPLLQASSTCTWVSESFDSVVRVVEELRPVVAIRAAVNSVTFRSGSGSSSGTKCGSSRRVVW